MIEFKTGNILKDNSDAIVNTVNCVGVMGKGLALQFKKAFPENFKEYKKACDNGQVKTGEVFITEHNDIVSKKWIINFPTKNHWKGRSEISYITQGLDDLILNIQRLGISSIAIPPLGAGLGGLEWPEVRQAILDKLGQLDNVKVTVYEPTGSPQADQMVNNTPRPKMTRGRALLIKLLEFYFQKGYSCSKIEVQKLAYFLQESGLPLRLKYKPHHFGPYADNLNHVLERIDGHFITGFGDRVTRSEIHLVESAISEANDFLKDDHEALQCLSRVEQLIDGYETPLSMEVISTVHWVIKHEQYPSSDFEGIRSFIHQWNEHKASWKDSYLRKAIHRIETLQWA